MKAVTVLTARSEKGRADRKCSDDKSWSKKKTEIHFHLKCQPFDEDQQECSIESNKTGNYGSWQSIVPMSNVAVIIFTSKCFP